MLGTRSGSNAATGGRQRRRWGGCAAVVVLLASLVSPAPALPAVGAPAAAAKPQARGHHAMAYDAARERTVLFGGYTWGRDEPFGDTWEWDGETWRELQPAASPSPRLDAGMAYDERRGVVVLFGGYDWSETLADTWVWDGSSWTQLHPGTSPSGRGAARMVYDAAREEVVLLRAGETWTWDGVTWTQQHTTTAPKAAVPSLAFDAARGEVVAFFATRAGDVWSSETWVWDGTTWTKRKPGTSPSPRNSATLVYDGARGETLLFGGGIVPFVAGRAGTAIRFAQTWVWDGTTWAQRHPASLPERRAGAPAVYDAARNGVLLFGGIAGNHGDFEDDTWTWDGTTWSKTEIPPADGGWTLASHRPARTEETWARMAYDEARAESVLVRTSCLQPSASRLPPYSGRVFTCMDTLTWDGSAWHDERPAVSPPPRWWTGLAYHPASRKTVLFGGANNVYGLPALDDTWLWDGAAWRPAVPLRSPRARYGHAQALDAGGHVVVFGGTHGIGTFGLVQVPLFLGDTWTWDGTRWTEEAPANRPPPRFAPAMAYDPARGVTVLFGGWGDVPGKLFSDTWTWDGKEWTEQRPATSPPAMSSATITYDPVTRRIVLFGGLNRLYENETWTWDGVTWTEQDPRTVPPRRIVAAMATDVQRGEVVMYGGRLEHEGDAARDWYSSIAVSKLDQYGDDTWIWRGRTPPSSRHSTNKR